MTDDADYRQEATAAYAWAWNAAAGDPVKYEQMAAAETARLHERFPEVIPADMRAPTRAEILARLLKR